MNVNVSLVGGDNTRPKLRWAFGRFPRLLFFSFFFYQKQCKYARNIGVAHIEGVLL